MYENQSVLINEQNTCDYISLYELRPAAETRIIVNRLRQIRLLAQTHTDAVQSDPPWHKHQPTIPGMYIYVVDFSTIFWSTNTFPKILSGQLNLQ